MELLTLDQRDFRDRLYEQIPAEWLPDLQDAPNAAAVLDMLASTWSSHQVVERTVQFDVPDASVVLLDGIYVIPIGASVSGPGITSNPTVVRTGTQIIPTVINTVVHPRVSNSATVTLNTTGGLTVGMTASGIGVSGSPSIVTILNPTTVVLSSAQTLADGATLIFTGTGPVYQTVTLSASQTIPQGTRLIFRLPDTIGDGLIEAMNFMRAQSRLDTSTGLFLDLWGQDFFGNNLQRHIDETDTSYRRRLLVNVLAPRVSRCSVFCGVSNLTGFDPVIIEPRNTGDCGAYSTLGNAQWSHIAYNKAGYYGSMLLPFQYFVKATRPTGAGIPIVNGYSMASGGYATIPQPYGYIGASHPSDTGTGEYVTLADLQNNRAVTDNDIYQMVAECSAAGVTGWVNITSDIESEIRAGGLTDVSFYLDLTTLSDQSTPLGTLFGSGSFNLNCTGLIIDEVAATKSSIFIQCAALLSNPIIMHASTTLSSFSMHAVASIDTHLVTGVTDVIPILASVSAINANNFVFSTATVQIVPVVTFADTVSMSGTGALQLQASAFTASIAGIAFGPVSVAATMLNGSFGVTYISQNFTTGSSTLTPPGGLLAKTVLLGASKIGVNYGY